MEIGKSWPAIPETSKFSIEYTPRRYGTHGRCSSFYSEDSPPPTPPPNTARQSRQSSVIHLQRQTSDGNGDDESDDDYGNNEDDMPIMPSVNDGPARAQSAQSARAPTSAFGYLDIAPAPRHKSLPSSPNTPCSLSKKERHKTAFKFHRDSIELTRGLLKRQEMEGKINQHLLNAHRDSFVLNKSNFDLRYRKSSLSSVQGWNRSGGLSPIEDSSPPNSFRGRVASTRATPSSAGSPGHEEKEPEWKSHVANEHVNCPICEVERPRWFEAHFRK